MRKILITICITLALASSIWGQNPEAADQKAESKPVVHGTILWQGKHFAPREVLWPIGSRGKNMVLERLLLDKVVKDESLLVGPKSKGIANCAIIVTENELGNKQPTIVPVEVKDLRFNERFLIVRPGGRLRLRNLDPLGYRFVIASDKAIIREFELGPSGQLDLDLPVVEKLVIFEKNFPFLRCTICQPSWAPVLVTTTEGKFDIIGLTPGPAKLAFWHETLGAAVKTIEVKADGPTMVALTQADFDNLAPTRSFQDLASDKDPVLKVNGIGVGKKVFEDVAEFVRTRYDDFALPKSTLYRYAIDAVIIPLVASLDHHQKQFDGLKEKLQTIDATLAEGKTLQEAATLTSAAFYGTDSPWTRRRDLEPWLGTQVFSAPKTLVIGPVASATGLNYFSVTASTGRGVSEKRRFQHLYLSFRPDLNATQLNSLVAELSKRARVEALDLALEPFIAPRNKD